MKSFINFAALVLVGVLDLGTLALFIGMLLVFVALGSGA